MSDEVALEALSKVRELAKFRRYVVQDHCRRQMDKRRISEPDAIAALRQAEAIRRSDTGSRSDWTVMGPDLDGAPLAVAVMLDDAPPGMLELVTAYEPYEDDDGWTRRGHRHE